MTPAPAFPFIACSVKTLHEDLAGPAAKSAIAENPANAPSINAFAGSGETLPPGHLALLTSRYWGVGGVKLSVQFLDTNDATLKARILSHMNAWGEQANVVFSLTSGQGDVRIARTPGDGYWSYLGTDVRHIPAGQPTMNLDSFSMGTLESEYHRVVRHETGHTLGFPHEHMRAALVRRLDPQKTIAYFTATQGWSAQMVEQQVLTPLLESDLTATPADQTSIMCYSLPAEITTDGQPIAGGTDINPTDFSLAARIYPKATVPTPTPTPTGAVWTVTLQGTGPAPKIATS